VIARSTHPLTFVQGVSLLSLGRTGNHLSLPGQSYLGAVALVLQTRRAQQLVGVDLIPEANTNLVFGSLLLLDGA
jgi:hypothetical protein